MSHSMQRLWAPWRMNYIKKKGKKPCPFCALTRERPSAKNLLLWKGKDFFVVMNRFPYNPAHLLVIPNAHCGLPSELPLEVWENLNRGLRACLQILERHHHPHGFNLGMNLGGAAGAGIPDHLHWHILPRWQGDSNFMPLLAETKALPAHNESVYKSLRPLFTDFDKHLKLAKIKRA